jgi:hypothetical protein
MGPGGSGQSLALPLLVLRIFTDDANDPAAVDDLALITYFLYGCTNLHNNS